jgi:hypothetical protein
MKLAAILLVQACLAEEGDSSTNVSDDGVNTDDDGTSAADSDLLWFGTLKARCTDLPLWWELVGATDIEPSERDTWVAEAKELAEGAWNLLHEALISPQPSTLPSASTPSPSTLPSAPASTITPQATPLSVVTSLLVAPPPEPTPKPPATTPGGAAAPTGHEAGLVCDPELGCTNCIPPTLSVFAMAAARRELANAVAMARDSF